MIVTRSDPEPEPKVGLRRRVKEAGGLYAFVNGWLVRVAGPASVGPYDTEPEPTRTERPCPLCRRPMSEHSFDRSGPKPLMSCPR